MLEHELYMKLALENAKAMKGQTTPNPLVGSVIVNDNRIVGIGAHMKAGEPHAEIHAIRMAGEQARGGTIYVTLEPCSHHGRTGPCAEAIVQAGIKRVVVATLDPNPLVSGRGIQILQDAGIEVLVGVCEEESKKMNEVFNKYILTKRPFVTIKSGVTLDGKIATSLSDSKWITSTEARQEVHQIRNENAAILVGANTVQKDNPSLTTRIPNGRNPIRVILDSTLRIPMEANVVTDGEAPTWIFTTNNHAAEKKKALENAGVKVFVTSGEKHINLYEMLDVLGQKGISSLLIEGGGEVNASFIENKLMDKLILYVAPKIIGGRLAPSFVEGTGITKMQDAIEFKDISFTQVGKDYRFIGYPEYRKI
ncbi:MULTISPECIES: bifunctional diaminohydroxyphosphoribosylaminopyrimidine deaminase/5-amino-6-(5-phosphoribosylamino)uracil reductase RibD [unclassified Bacillus cereus group]|uniref:bifunctional diaminohydroxyphosphoribosylaminopyrimidine deaminase/5-amino-6-(5-phosphoribosylamino)uracil reductase RibD n=1 Tax=Bacillus cereus group TaxID=86661 RepID=UPI000BF46962|nr:MULTISPECIES: bifunctional diaminohydroxyphosphoribosylaminopyrimidine deaminase/5-amino-6-(5-phosphoribosylamino)uracil reductase RibD [unclassified Bacillus cereus group]PES82537.1 riboflavin biosynthesis protein RibD [Bacillus anthracis]WAI27014.1 MAG: bifunctional diaminohydroxyphosphoribosylaminopyrimidine deaminase/5-amino-6-(5-phosphoribosylamino)uracil reductase RibD [Bacillus paranthracis]MDA1532462.1 bifunctional diaminohydroxyphosphoribosylaminopyrimidine deaminase/5-amino-6-(5-pho